MKKNNVDVKRVVIVGLMSALVFLGTYIMKIDISWSGGQGHTMIHLGNMFCIVAAILFGPKCGALSGAIGMSLFDIISGRFIMYFPFTFILKYIVGYVCGYVKIKNIDKIKTNKLNCLAIFSGLIINIIFSPIISFFMRVVIYNFNFYVAAVNTIGSLISVIIDAILSFCLSFILIKFLEPILFNKKNIY